jgi:hypothetical protein
VETVEANLSKGMRQLNGVYTQQFNRNHNRVGHVYQGRYKAILVEKESYLLELSRYVVLNPVRAGMVKNIDHWPWSSYPAMIGKSGCPEWLQADWMLGQFGDRRKLAIAAYMWTLFEQVWGYRVFGRPYEGRFILVMMNLSKNNENNGVRVN